MTGRWDASPCSCRFRAVAAAGLLFLAAGCGSGEQAAQVQATVLYQRTSAGPLTLWISADAMKVRSPLWGTLLFGKPGSAALYVDDRRRRVMEVPLAAWSEPSPTKKWVLRATEKKERIAGVEARQWVASLGSGKRLEVWVAQSIPLPPGALPWLRALAPGAWGTRAGAVLRVRSLKPGRKATLRLDTERIERVTLQASAFRPPADYPKVSDRPPPFRWLRDS